MGTSVPMLTSPAQEFAQGIAPAGQALLGLLKEKAERAQTQQQLMAQYGQLQLAQEKFAEEQKQQNEKKKGLLQLSEGLKAEAAKLQEPGPLQQEIEGAFGSRDPRLFEAVMLKVQRAGALQRTATVRSNFQQLAESQGGALTEEQKIDFYDQYLQADPENPQAGSIATVLNTLRGGKGGGRHVVRIRSETRGDTQYDFAVFSDGSQEQLGEGNQVPLRNLAFRVERYLHGTQPERRVGALATRAMQAHERITKLENNAPEAAAEAMALFAASKIVGGKVLMPASRAATMSPQGREAFALYNDFLEVSLPMMHGLRVTDVQKALSENAHFPGPGEFNPQVLHTVQQNRMRIIEAGLESGPPGRARATPDSTAANTSALDRLRKKYGLP